MTVAELIAHLRNKPQDKEVIIDTPAENYRIGSVWEDVHVVVVNVLEFDDGRG